MRIDINFGPLMCGLLFNYFIELIELFENNTQSTEKCFHKVFSQFPIIK